MKRNQAVRTRGLSQLSPRNCPNSPLAVETVPFIFKLLWGLMAAAILLLNSSFIEAADRYWQVSSGDWSTASNWGGIIPTSIDNAFIVNGGTATIDQSESTCINLIIGSTSSGTIEMTSGHFYLYDAYIGNSNEGTFRQSGGITTFDMESFGALVLGYTSTGVGIYFLSGSGFLIGTYKASEVIGDYGTGIFNQSGGTNEQWRVTLAQKSGSNGTYNLTGGTLSVGVGSIIKGSGTAAFNFGGGTIITQYNLTTTIPMTLTGEGGNAIIDTNGYTPTFSGNLSGIGGLNKQNLGTLVLSGTNTYSGDTNITAGKITLGNSYALQNSTFNNSSSGTLSFGTLVNATLGGIKGNQSLSLNNDSASAVELQVGYNGQSTVYSGSFSGIGSLAKIGTGTLTLSGGSNFTGPVNFNGGFINAASLYKLGSGTQLIFNGGGLQFSGVFDPSVRAMTFLVGGATLDTQSNNIILANPIGNSGAGGLTKLGSGKLTLNALNTYSGDTIVKGGTLEITKGIGASGTSLIDVQLGKAVLKTVNVSKADLDITTAASATFEVLSGAHLVGSISGSGITQVDSGASLTAASIRQGSLIIGSNAKLTIQLITGGPLSGAINSVPEPSAIVLLAVAFLLVTFFSFKAGGCRLEVGVMKE